MRLIPSRARLAALGLVTATVTIIALAIMVINDLDSDVRGYEEVSFAQQVKDDLHSLRVRVLELRSATRLGVRTGDAEAFHNVELRALEVESDLNKLRRLTAAGTAIPALQGLSQPTRLLVLHARSVAEVRRARGAESAGALAKETELLTVDATAAIERSLADQTVHIKEGTQAQIQLGERLRRFIAGLLGGSTVALVGLFVAYRKAQVREREAQRRIEHLAHFDMVTGLPNRALLSDRLAQETSRARRSGRGFAVLLFDLDGFKSVNDTWGHAAGDRVLAIVAERARKCVRSSDTVGRQGGDEFLAILPETGLEGALGVAEKLRESLRAPYPIGSAEARLSTSVGVSLFPDHGFDPEAVQRAADAALYRAKREGKDRVAVASEMPRSADAPGISRSAA